MEKRKEEFTGKFYVVNNHPEKSEKTERSVRRSLYEVYKKYKQEERK